MKTETVTHLVNIFNSAVKNRFGIVYGDGKLNKDC